MFRATFTRLSAALFACIVLLLPAASHGQGTNGTVPEPMGLRNATTLIGRHAILDGPARLAIEAAHDRYLEAFARFRDGDVQKLLGIMDEMQGQGGAMPEIEVLDRFLDEWANSLVEAGVQEVGNGLESVYEQGTFDMVYVRGTLFWHEAHRLLGDEGLRAVLTAWVQDNRWRDPAGHQLRDWLRRAIRARGRDSMALEEAWQSVMEGELPTEMPDLEWPG